MTINKNIKIIINLLFAIVIVGFVYKVYLRFVQENAILKQMLERLAAESRVAEVLVTGVNFDEKTQKNNTTIKFLEYDVLGRPLEPKYFTFTGNIIQFQSLVIRFDDIYVRKADKFKGKSAYIFWKVFMLDGPNTQEYEITPINSIPQGYKIPVVQDIFEGELWEKFWKYALNPQKAKKSGIRNAQIEAPGTMFIPGILYTINIEHDGGLIIQSAPLSPILIGEKIQAM